MSKLPGFVLLTLGLSSPLFAQAPAEDPWKEHRSTRVLYAGKSGGQREQVFGAFLREHFDRTAAIPLEKLSMASAKDFDVVIADWMSQYGNDGYAAPDGLHGVPLDLGPEFTKPIVAMSYVSSGIRGGYKLDWL